MNISASPLALVSRDPALTELVDYLVASRVRIMASPSENHVLEFSRRRLEESRAAFADMILRGEARLHALCEVLAAKLLGGYDLQSVVVGEVVTTRERFTLLQPILPRDLYSHTDLDLGTRQLQRIQ